MEKNGLTDLSSNEMMEIQGGINLFTLKLAVYGAAYVIGYACGEVTTFLGGMKAGFENDPN